MYFINISIFYIPLK